MNTNQSLVLGARFQGKRVIVTGAGSGMGRAVVRRLVGEGATVLAVDLNEDGLKETVAAASALAAYGGKASLVRASVADEAAVRELVGAFAAGGGVDALINMAGILRFCHTTETTADLFMSIINVNLFGSFVCCREALPFLEKNGGNIVNVASTAAEFGTPYAAAYSASKGGVLGLTKSLAKEYLLRGVRVNAIVPGGFETPMVASADPQQIANVDMRLFANLIRPDYVMGQVDQVASLVAMLASEDGSFITGDAIRIDGGVHG